MNELLLKALTKDFQIEERDIGEYKRVKKGMFDFTIHSYVVEGVGNLSTLHAKAMFGLMIMESFILTPFEKDMPLFNWDIMSIGKKDIAIIECYDTRLNKGDLSLLDSVKGKYAELQDGENKPHWYDDIRLSCSLHKVSKKKEKVIEMSSDFFNEYLRLLSSSGTCDKTKKIEASSSYVQGLLTNGGPSTDQFKKMIGEEKTRELFEKYIFGTTAK